LLLLVGGELKSDMMARGKETSEKTWCPKGAADSGALHRPGAAVRDSRGEWGKVDEDDRKAQGASEDVRELKMEPRSIEGGGRSWREVDLKQLEGARCVDDGAWRERWYRTVAGEMHGSRKTKRTKAFRGK
jgi:hypothetical protein